MDYGLSVQQLAVICALSSGATVTGAAEQAGLHRNTISNWRRNSPPFEAALAHAQYDRALLFREKAEELVDLALTTIHEILSNPDTPPGVRLKAALFIVQTASTPPLPKKQVELDIEKIRWSRTQTVTPDQMDAAPPEPVHNSAQPSSGDITGAAPDSDPQDPPAVHNSAQSSSDDIPGAAPDSDPQDPQAVHNSAQSRPAGPENVANCPRTAKNVARNALCPCGSGRKYKRCCLDRHPAGAAAA